MKNFLPYLPYGSATEDALESAWTRCTRNNSPVERDFLRALHSLGGLWDLTWALNSDLFSQDVSVSLTSIWVDHTPQCWFGPVKNSVWTKPSCELADLLIVAWDDKTMRSGRALLLQGKMANNPGYLLGRNTPSTQNELKLLENSPAFLLSNQSSVRSGKNPAPYVPSGKSDFCLKSFGTNAKAYQHCRFLQIRKPKAKLWGPPVSSWQTYWPVSGQTLSYAQSLTEMILRLQMSQGCDFQRHSNQSDWDALINVLIDTTVSLVRHGTAKGPAQTQRLAQFEVEGPKGSPALATVSRCPAYIIQNIVMAKMFEYWPPKPIFQPTSGGNDWFELPEVEKRYEPSGGIPIVFITPHRHETPG